jgi:hypothetical protein
LPTAKDGEAAVPPLAHRRTARPPSRPLKDKPLGGVSLLLRNLLIIKQNLFNPFHERPDDAESAQINKRSLAYLMAGSGDIYLRLAQVFCGSIRD